MINFNSNFFHVVLYKMSFFCYHSSWSFYFFFGLFIHFWFIYLFLHVYVLSFDDSLIDFISDFSMFTFHFLFHLILFKFIFCFLFFIAFFSLFSKLNQVSWTANSDHILCATDGITRCGEMEIVAFKDNELKLVDSMQGHSGTCEKLVIDNRWGNCNGYGFFACLW